MIFFSLYEYAILSPRMGRISLSIWVLMLSRKYDIHYILQQHIQYTYLLCIKFHIIAIVGIRCYIIIIIYFHIHQDIFMKDENINILTLQILVLGIIVFTRTKVLHFKLEVQHITNYSTRQQGPNKYNIVTKYHDEVTFKIKSNFIFGVYSIQYTCIIHHVILRIQNFFRLRLIFLNVGSGYSYFCPLHITSYNIFIFYITISSSVPYAIPLSLITTVSRLY